MSDDKVAFAAVGRLEQYGQCTLLAEVASTSGNMADIAMRILRRLPVAPPGARRSFKYESGYTFHFLCDGSLVFIAMERDVGADGAFSLLTRVQQRWISQFGSTNRLVGNISGYRDFERTLSELVHGSGNGGDGGPSGSSGGNSGGGGGVAGDEEMEELGAVQERLEGIKSVMADSIEKVLERGERIDLLVDKTDRLHQQAFKFARCARDQTAPTRPRLPSPPRRLIHSRNADCRLGRSSTSLKRTMRWRSVRCMIGSLAAAVVVLLLAGASYCGGLNVGTCVSTSVSGGVKASEEWISSATKESAKEAKHPL